MAEFLGTHDVNTSLHRIIKDAQTVLVIISPYIRLHNRLRDLFEEKDIPDIDFRLVYRHKEDARHRGEWAETTKWLDSLDHVKTSYLEDLHAKCYLNENEALVTSMNLYEYSQDKNYEMGILVSKENDRELYDKVLEESNTIVRRSKDARVRLLTKIASGASKLAGSASKRISDLIPDQPQVPTRGFCIRCKTDIAANPLKPFCSKDQKVWAMYLKDDYEEKYCHTCGESNKTSKKLPSCRKCYHSYKSVLDYPGS